jgi:hypothetical protein
MTVRANKPAFNIREKLKELTHSIGLKGRELMRAATVQEARDLVSAGRKNLIINGGFDVWQRGTSFLNNNTTGYKADRWQVYGASTSVLDITRQAFSAGQTEVEGNPKYYIRLDNTPDADNTWIELFQRIEDVTYFSNITVTLSFWIKSNRSFTNNNYFKFKQNFGSGGSSAVDTDSSNFDISTSWEKKTLTVTLPSVSGKTIGANNYLEVHLLQNSSVDADTQYDIAQVQLEVGRNATEFEHRSYGEELALCQRYFWSLTNNYNNSWNPLTWGHGGSANRVFTNIVCPVAMRDTPSIYNKQVNVQDGGIASDVTDRLYPAGGTAYIIEYGGFDEQTHLALQITAASTTDGNGYRVNVKNVSGTAGYIYFDAEL